MQALKLPGKHSVAVGNSVDWSMTTPPTLRSDPKTMSTGGLPSCPTRDPSSGTSSTTARASTSSASFWEGRPSSRSFLPTSRGPAGRYPTIHAEVLARNFVVWEGRTWHAASLNTGTGPRIGITAYWSAPFLRQLLNFAYGLRPEVAADLSEHERGLMASGPGAPMAPTKASSPSGSAPAPTTQVRSSADQDMASAHAASRVCPRQPTPALGT